MKICKSGDGLPPTRKYLYLPEEWYALETHYYGSYKWMKLKHGLVLLENNWMWKSSTGRFYSLPRFSVWDDVYTDKDNIWRYRYKQEPVMANPIRRALLDLFVTFPDSSP
jgi:hypothetical protein